ncbi:hypothetical protein GCM10023148_16640 [Actinokineospora soli]
MHPAPTLPALADPTTKLIVTSRGTEYVVLAAVGALTLLGAFIGGYLWADDDLMGVLWNVLAGLGVTAVAGLMVVSHLRRDRVVTALATHPWRPVDAVVCRGGTGLRRVVVEAGGVTLAVRLGPAQEHMIRRTGRAWIITGASATVLRVDGSHGFAVARHVKPVDSRVEGEVDEDRFAASLLEARRLRFDAPASAEWTWVPTTLDPWTASGDRTTATGWATLADERRVRVSVRGTIDFLGTAWEAQGFWVAGEPACGRDLVAGFPEAPLAASIRFEG